MLKSRHRANSVWGAFLANLLNKQKSGFTLAETLIALGVIGIVAALTLPSLLTTINNKVKNHQVEVFTRKFAKGTDLLNIENGIGPYYNSSTPSYEFAQALSKHLKIVTICHSGNDMKNCFPDTVKVGDETVDITKITSGENFGLDKENYTDVAGIVLGDGTPMILSWNKNCPVSDPDVVASKGNSNQSASLTYSCVKGFYDLNGFRGPNRISNNIKRLDDVIGFNGTSALSEGAGGCLFELASGKCLIAPPNEYVIMQYEECMEHKNELGLEYCAEGGDEYAGAARACGGTDKIATLEDLIPFAQSLYGDSFINFHQPNGKRGTTSVESIIAAANAYGLTTHSSGKFTYIALWYNEGYESEDDDGISSADIYFYGPSGYQLSGSWRGNDDSIYHDVLCVGDK